MLHAPSQRTPNMLNSIHVATHVNNILSVNVRKCPLTPNNVHKRLPHSEYTALKTEQKKTVNEIIISKKLKGAERELLEYYVHNCDKVGVTECSQQIAASKLPYRRETLNRAHGRLLAKGIIESKKRGWQETNTTTIICLVPETELHNKCDEKSHKYNYSYSASDHKYKHTYDEYVTILTDSVKENPKTKTPHGDLPRGKTRHGSKHISEPRLKADPETEINRAGKAHGLSDSEIRYAILKMKQDENDIKLKAPYLARMIQRIKAGDQNMSDVVDPAEVAREALEKRMREAQAHALEAQRHKEADEAHERAMSNPATHEIIKRALAQCGLKRDYYN